MKPTGILINVSRGGLIDEMALANTLRAGKIGGAGIDVLAGLDGCLDPLVVVNPMVLDLK